MSMGFKFLLKIREQGKDESSKIPDYLNSHHSTELKTIRADVDWNLY